MTRHKRGADKISTGGDNDEEGDHAQSVSKSSHESIEAHGAPRVKLESGGVLRIGGHEIKLVFQLCHQRVYIGHGIELFIGDKNARLIIGFVD